VKLYLIPIVLCVSALAQWRVIDHSTIDNFGGQPRTSSCGMNKGDWARVDITCEDPFRNTCLAINPALDRKAMQQIPPFGDDFNQSYRRRSGYTGNHVFTLQYWRVGKRYRVELTCRENFQ
jgi:hypothetical protein